MISKFETYGGSFPFEPHFSSAPGFQMHYVDEGHGEVVLCLHGEPTWGYLFRHLIGQLSDEYRVVVLDHMGFGKSETPGDRTYWLQDHIDNLEKLVLELDLRGISLVVHDFGGPIGMGLAARHPDRIKRVVSINGPTPFGQPELAELFGRNVKEAPWFQWVMRAEADGKLEQVLGELHYNILSTLKLNGFERGEVITDTWIEAYRGAFCSVSESVGAMSWAKGMAIGAHVFEEPSAAAKEKMRGIPALAIWGKEDKTLYGKYFLPLFRAVFPAGIVQELPGVGHYSPEDAPEVVGALVRLFLKMTTAGR